ncbi:hypothetical protein [Phyllobacterium chamaecytisi]|uniref:hypothetical protein n=1 Tax=Phyllobacterium chamaecytisi TaxID=2876082 RepID=UPI001CCB3F12|nr:hypothetical protein [Phyllobacterium sp. KW56]MBZ9603231.1 hypothetical protein [Phyllobacterium sp. KW56]
MSKYRYFYHVKRSDYRLVIPRGRDFPPGLDASDWALQEERSHDRVHKEVMKDIERNGFGSYQQDIHPAQIPAG